MSNIIWAVEYNIKELNTRRKLFRKLINVFEEAEWDDIDQCLGESKAFDMAYYDEYPDMREVN